jgi:hypothetical protein
LDNTNNFPESNIKSSTNIKKNKNYQRTNNSQQKRKKKIKIIDNLSKKGTNKPKNNISCIVINSGRHKNAESNDKLISKNLNAYTIRNNKYKYNDSKNKNKNKYKSCIAGKKKIKVIKNTNENLATSNKYREKCAIKIQSNFRRFIFQKLLTNNINLYMRFAKAIYLLIKVCNFNKIFFMHQLKKKFRRNKRDNSKSYNSSEYSNNGLKMKMKRIIEENNELKKESIDYRIFKDKYNDMIEENKKIQNRNHLITKQNLELIKQLKEIKNKNKSMMENEEKRSKEIKRKNRNKSNLKKQKLITNNYTIQSQVNIIFAEPKIIKKEKKVLGKEKKEEKKIGKEKNDKKLNTKKEENSEKNDNK